MKAFNRLGFLNKPAIRLFGVLVLLIGLIIYRQPLLLVSPRFWGEEGSFIFPYAYSHSFWQSLFYTLPLAGYYTLLHNIAAIIAAMLPLEWAPFATTYIALFFMIIPCVIVLFGNVPLWDTLPKKLVICLGIVLLPFESMWLNSTYIHFTLGIIAFLILLENPDQLSPLKKNTYRVLLIISGLTASIACFLTPAYLLRAIWSRTRESYIQVLILAISAIIHLPIVFSRFISSSGPQLQTRFANYSLQSLYNIIYFQFDAQLFGRRLFDFVKSGASPLDMWFKLITMRNFGFSAVYLPTFTEIIITTFVLSYLAFLTCKHLRDREAQLIIFSFFLLFLFSSLLSVGMEGGPRYSYTPAVVLLTLVLAEFMPNVRSKTRRLIATTFIILILGINLLEYRDGNYCSYGWPVWREEVSKWRQDSSYQLKIWPQFEKWEMTLQPRK